MHTELLRELWDDLDRLEEDFHHWDRGRTGFLPRDTLYSVLRGSRIPADVELINSMLDQYVNRYEFRPICQHTKRFVFLLIVTCLDINTVNIIFLQCMTVCFVNTIKMAKVLLFCLKLDTLKVTINSY